MAQAKYSRIDGRKSSSYCSTISIVVFVAFCLVAIWTLMSSIVPDQNPDLASEDAGNEVKQMVPENGSRNFKGSSGDLLEDSTNEDGNTGNEQNIVERESENRAEENQDEGVKVNSDDKSESEEEPKRQDENDGEGKNEDGGTDGGAGEVMDAKQTEFDDNKSELVEGEKKLETEESNLTEEKKVDQPEIFPAGAQSELLNEATTQNGAFSTQATESQNEKESQQASITKDQSGYSWKVCNVTAGPDYIPCLDNLKAIRKLPSTGHYEHRERHCPDEAPTCLVPLPKGYKIPIQWPKSREKVYQTSS